MPGSELVGVGSRKVILLLITSSDENSVYTCVLKQNTRLLYETEKSIIAPL